MKRLVAATLVILMCAGAAVMARAEVAPQPVDYVLRVTSAVPGTEVKFDAAVLFKTSDASLQTFRHKTPYEIHMTGLAASGMFQAQGGFAIHVELVGAQGGKQRSRSTATGRTVVVGDNVVRNEAGYITTF
jgi:hypothetical protein